MRCWNDGNYEYDNRLKQLNDSSSKTVARPHKDWHFVKFIISGYHVASYATMNFPGAR